jgi:hypothetical protein
MTATSHLKELRPEQIEEILESARKRQADERREKLERLRQAVKAGPVPLSDEITAKLACLNGRDAADILRNHPGFPLSERCHSYRTSVAVFEQSVGDLLSAIDSFEAASGDGTIFDPIPQVEIANFERRIQKEMFAAASAAHSLVDHSRRLQMVANVPGYSERLKVCFGADGLHEFVIALRTMLHHLHILEAGWNIRRDCIDKTSSATFVLEKAQLSLALEKEKGSSAGVSRFLAGSEDRIDLRLIFNTYRERARNFHAWFSAELGGPAFDALRDYERCCSEGRHHAARLMWKGLVKNWLAWSAPPNPYDHLKRYLTPEQLQQVYEMPMDSTGQVDKVIEFVDRENVCDVELRELAYELFRRGALRLEHKQ